MSTALHAACDAATVRSISQSVSTTYPSLVLLTCILASSLAFVDSSVVNVGLPIIGHTLAADAGSMPWVVNAYMLPLSALLLLGGAVGDRYGRRQMLMGGIALFALASLFCALAPTLFLLLCGRLAQGVGAAILIPNSLAILGATFTGEAKGRAIGIWAAAGAVAGAVGPVLGGWLIDVGSWRAIFAIGLPLAIAAILLAQRFVPNDSDRREQPLDVVGGELASLGLGGLTWGLTIGSGWSGWTASATGLVVAGLVLLMLFVRFEKRRGDQAMMPLSLFGSRSFVGLTLLTLFLYGALGGLIVLIPYILIEAAGYSGTAAGAALLPLPLAIVLISPLMGGIAGRFGARIPLSIGPLVVGLGFLLAVRITGDRSYWSSVLPAICVIAVGMSLSSVSSSRYGSPEIEATGPPSCLRSASSQSACPCRWHRSRPRSWARSTNGMPGQRPASTARWLAPADLSPQRSSDRCSSRADQHC